jgi:hypothetical protein
LESERINVQQQQSVKIRLFCPKMPSGDNHPIYPANEGVIPIVQNFRGVHPEEVRALEFVVFGFGIVNGIAVPNGGFDRIRIAADGADCLQLVQGAFDVGNGVVRAPGFRVPVKQTLKLALGSGFTAHPRPEACPSFFQCFHLLFFGM